VVMAVVLVTVARGMEADFGVVNTGERLFTVLRK